MRRLILIMIAVLAINGCGDGCLSGDCGKTVIKENNVTIEVPVSVEAVQGSFTFTVICEDVADIVIYDAYETSYLHSENVAEGTTIQGNLPVGVYHLIGTFTNGTQKSVTFEVIEDELTNVKC